MLEKYSLVLNALAAFQFPSTFTDEGYRWHVSKMTDPPTEVAIVQN